MKDKTPSTTNSMPSSSEIGNSFTPSDPTIDEAITSFYRSCKLAKLDVNHPVMWKDIQKAYKGVYTALDDKELERLFSTSNLESIVSTVFPCLDLNDTNAGYQITMRPEFEWDGAVIKEKGAKPQPPTPPKPYAVAVGKPPSFEDTMLSPNLISFNVEDVAQRTLIPVRNVITKFRSHDHVIKTRNQLTNNYKALIAKLKSVVDEHKKSVAASSKKSDRNTFNRSRDNKNDDYMDSMTKFITHVGTVRADDEAFMKVQLQWFEC